MRKATAAQQQPSALVLPPLRPRDARAQQPPAAKAVPLLDAFVVPDCLSASECAALCAAATPSLTLATSRGPRHGEALRRHGRAEVSSPAYAAQLWARLRPALAAALPAATGLSPRLRLYRYAPGDVFGPHYDESSALLAEDDGRRLTTLYTVLFYISAPDVSGGETVFFAEGDEARELCRVPPTPGSALVFRQGPRGMLHSCGAVRSGTKWVLRTDLAFPA
jgi:predicted 2-oxoglutarate/Fe(II)-dependent dioxygenase YbiX